MRRKASFSSLANLYAEGVGNGLSSEGIIVEYPQTCTAKSGCRVHIALHGCEQNRDQVGMTFIEGSGFARWADTNRLVILFPQVEAASLILKRVGIGGATPERIF